MRRGLMTRLRNQAKQRTQMSKRSEPKKDLRNVDDGDFTQAVSTSVCIHACENIHITSYIVLSTEIWDNF
jgi:hypothetical protein